MDGLSRAIGAGMPVKIGENTYMLSPLTLEDFGLIENEMLAKRPNPMQRVMEVYEKLPEALRDKFLERAYQDAKRTNKIPAAEVAAYVDSIEGMMLSMWLSIKKCHPEITREKMNEIMRSLSPKDVEAMRESRDIASGIDQMGNSTGPAT